MVILPFQKHYLTIVALLINEKIILFTILATYLDYALQTRAGLRHTHNFGLILSLM